MVMEYFSCLQKQLYKDNLIQQNYMEIVSYRQDKQNIMVNGSTVYLMETWLPISNKEKLQ